MVNYFTNFMNDEQGAIALEYVVVTFFIIATLILGVKIYAKELAETFQAMAKELDYLQKIIFDNLVNSNTALALPGNVSDAFVPTE